MKKKLEKTLALVLCVFSLLLSASCGMHGQIESIQVFDNSGNKIQEQSAIYKMNVKEVRLVESKNENNIIASTKEFKFMYLSEETVWKDETDSSPSEEKLEYYFPDVDFTTAPYSAYVNKVTLEIVFGGINKVYRPKYSISNGVATIEYYTFNYLAEGFRWYFATGLTDLCYKEEYDYAKAESMYKKEVKAYEKELDSGEETKDHYEPYKYTAGVFYNKKVLNTENVTILVDFHK